jgi:Spy/CpxP family protein refolding chaperone
MNAKWMVWVVVLALALPAAAMVARAQDRPAEPAIGAGDDRPAPHEISAVGDPMRDLDGLDMLLAAGMEPGAEAAQGPAPPAGPGMRGVGRGRAGMAELRKQLNLTDEQQTKLADIRDRSARAAIPIQGDLKIAGLDLRKLVRADKPDQRAIDAQIDKIAGLRAKLQKSRMASMLEAKSVLTPAQQKILRDARPGGRGMHRWMQGLPGDRGMGMGMEEGSGTQL